MTVAVIGWALLHSLWQGAAIAIVFAAFLAMARSAAPGVRYWAGLVALASMVAFPIATAFRTVGVSALPVSAVVVPVSFEQGGGDEPAPAAGDPQPGIDIAHSVFNNVPAGKSIIVTAQQVAERFVPWVVVMWFVGLVLASLRLLGGLVRTRQMTRRGVREATEVLQSRVRALAARIDLARVVRVLESTGNGAPLVIGVIRPVIVVPASLLTGLTPLQLDMLLAHELAHIRRHDFAINLAQTIIETLLFYHPAARWISTRIREERENCCDDIAVAVSGGRPVAYAETLLALEEKREHEYVLAAAATGGSLGKRIRRLVLREPAHVEIGPRWIAGLFTIAAALFAGREAVALGVHSSLLPGYQVASSSDTTDWKGRRPDPSKAAPSKVLRAPASGSLEERWRWAEQQGRQLGGSYWVGYTVAGDPASKSFYYASDVPVFISSGSVQMSGSMRFVDDDLSDITFSGVRLAPLVGAQDPRSTVILFQVSQGVTGRTIARTHVASFNIPAYFFGQPLLWLGAATDAESITKIGSLSSSASRDVRHNLVGAIGAHASDHLVVPVLSALALSRTDDEDVRQSAVESIARRNGQVAISTLSRVARTDRSTDVRREAIASFAHVDSPGATDSLISLARTALTESERRRAIEALGERGDQRALKFLTDLADSNADSRMRENAIEALGSMPDNVGKEYVERIARGAGSADSRRAAVEAIGSWKDADEALRTLNDIVRNDAHEDVRVAAVEAIASVHDARSVASLRELVNVGATEAVRSAAVEALGSTVDDVAAAAALVALAERHASDEIRLTAMETLADMKGTGIEYIESVIRGNQRDELRIRALEVYADHAGNARAVAVLRSVVLNDRREEIRLRALELLGDEGGEAGMNAVRDFARSSTNAVIRERAREILSDR